MNKKKVAFICVHNSCRSQIAEALGKHLASDVFESYSAGTVIALGIKSVFLILGALGIAGMWEAVFGDIGVTIIAVLNAMRILKK